MHVLDKFYLQTYMDTNIYGLTVILEHYFFVSNSDFYLNVQDSFSLLRSENRRPYTLK